MFLCTRHFWIPMQIHWEKYCEEFIKHQNKECLYILRHAEVISYRHIEHHVIALSSTNLVIYVIHKHLTTWHILYTCMCENEFVWNNFWNIENILLTTIFVGQNHSIQLCANTEDQYFNQIVMLACWKTYIRSRKASWMTPIQNSQPDIFHLQHSCM